MSNIAIGQREKIFADGVCKLAKRFLERLSATLVDPETLTGGLAVEKVSLLSLHLWLGNRIVALYEAARLLVGRRYPKEAAILTLAILETATDILYIRGDPRKAERWWAHTAQWASPVKMSIKWPDLRLAENLLAFYKDFYRWYSMIKHGNPVAGRNLYSYKAGSYPRRPQSWEDYLQRHRVLINLKLKTIDDMERDWRHHIDLRRTVTKVVRDARRKDAHFTALLFLVSGLLMYDSFQATAAVYRTTLPRVRDFIMEWKAELATKGHALIRDDLKTVREGRTA